MEGMRGKEGEEEEGGESDDVDDDVVVRLNGMLYICSLLICLATLSVNEREKWLSIRYQKPLKTGD